ncbi:hypothetical protein V5799_005930 [Amblyomma americanum]|uniref:Chitinase n=1 Tax=Amblyomma americanum TaxID=6943 RepID=A0AAQ4DXU9_AMBAM
MRNEHRAPGQPRRERPASGGHHVQGAASAGPLHQGQDSARRHSQSLVPSTESGRLEDQMACEDLRLHARRRHEDDTRSRSTSSTNDVVMGSPRRARSCLVVITWSLCVAGVATLVIPALFLLFPLIKAGFLNVPGVVPTPMPSTTLPTTFQPTVSPKTSPTTSPKEGTTSTIPSTSLTVSSSTAVTDECLEPSPVLHDLQNLSDLQSTSQAYKPPGPVGRRQPVYCIYNVTRFRRPKGYGFLPLHLPLAYCPGIVYWSWSLPGGQLTSRAKEFDEQYGLAAIKALSMQQSTTVDLFLTLGGYREDSADFHKLETDPTTRHRLVQDFYAAYLRYNLSGLNLHWVPNTRACETIFGGNVPRLGEFIHSIRALISLNVRNPGVFAVSAMVNPRELAQMEFFRAIRGHLNLTFFKTHEHSRTNSFNEYCGNSVMVLESQLARLKPFFRTPVVSPSTLDTDHQHTGVLCISVSLSLYARQGGHLQQPAPPQIVSATPGFMSLFEVCDSKLAFNERVNRVPGCVVKRTHGPLLQVTIAFDSAETLRTKMAKLGDYGDACVLVYDVDFDNYREGCSGGWERYLMIRHLYSARVRRSWFNLSEHLP